MRWPWSSPPAVPKSIFERIEHCESTVRALGAAFKDIETEWESTYRKMHNSLSSLNQKARAAQKATQIDEDAPQTTIRQMSEGEKLRIARARHG